MSHRKEIFEETVSAIRSESVTEETEAEAGFRGPRALVFVLKIQKGRVGLNSRQRTGESNHRPKGDR